MAAEHSLLRKAENIRKNRPSAPGKAPAKPKKGLNKLAEEIQAKYSDYQTKPNIYQPRPQIEVFGKHDDYAAILDSEPADFQQRQRQNHQYWNSKPICWA